MLLFLFLSFLSILLSLFSPVFLTHPCPRSQIKQKMNEKFLYPSEGKLGHPDLTPYHPSAYSLPLYAGLHEYVLIIRNHKVQADGCISDVPNWQFGCVCTENLLLPRQVYLLSKSHGNVSNSGQIVAPRCVFDSALSFAGTMARLSTPSGWRWPRHSKHPSAREVFLGCCCSAAAVLLPGSCREERQDCAVLLQPPCHSRRRRISFWFLNDLQGIHLQWQLHCSLGVIAMCVFLF